MRKLLIIITITLIILTTAYFSSPLYMPFVLSKVLSRQMGAKVEVGEARLSFKQGITASDISLTNSKGLRFNADRAIISFHLPSLIAMIKERTLYIPFRLMDMRFQSPGKTAVGSITETLGFSQIDRILFNMANGELYFRNKEVILKGIEASGENIKLFVDGTISNREVINCSFKILLSGTLIDSMPESTRSFFFKQDESWSKVELYLSGDINRPSVNFTTPLFKLTIR